MKQRVVRGEALSEGQQALSLYLQLKPGHQADLEVVARASLAFAAAIREIAFVLDPSIEVRIGLESGQPGSLSLNTIIKTIRGKFDRRTTLADRCAARVFHQ